MESICVEIRGHHPLQSLCTKKSVANGGEVEGGMPKGVHGGGRGKEEDEANHGRMASGGHGLPKVAPGPPCLTFLRPEMALSPFQGWPACR
jgi:hypothetical protein